MNELRIAIINTLPNYLIPWFLGVFVSIFVVSICWAIGKKISKLVYWLMVLFSFIPVTVLIPFFLRKFGLTSFIFPILFLPVFITVSASFYETLIHGNLIRETLKKNYNCTMFDYFIFVLIPESLPSLKISLRFSLSLCFTIFLVIDYFMETWGGLGELIHRYYNLISFNPSNNGKMIRAIVVTGLLGVIQASILSGLLWPLTRFRKYC